MAAANSKTATYLKVVFDLTKRTLQGEASGQAAIVGLVMIAVAFCVAVVTVALCASGHT